MVAALLTAWPTEERYGGLWRTYTVATTLQVLPKKMKRVFVLVLSAFSTLAKILPLL